MKKIIKICSLFIMFLCVFTLTSCVPEQEDARDKMLEKGYVTIDPTKLVTNMDENAKKVYLFVKADNQKEALDNLANPNQIKLIVYYFETEEYCKSVYDDYKREKEYYIDFAKDEYEKGNIDKEKYESTVENLKKQKLGYSKNCFFLGSKEAIRDFK